MENNVIHDNNVNSVNSNEGVNNVNMTDTLNLILSNQASQMNNLTASLRNTLNEFSAQIGSHMRNLTKDFALHNNKSEDPNGNRLSTGISEDPNGNRLPDSDADMGSEDLTENIDPDNERDLDPSENPTGNRGKQEKNKKRKTGVISHPSKKKRKDISEDSSSNDEDDQISIYCRDDIESPGKEILNLLNGSYEESASRNDGSDNDITTILDEIADDGEKGSPINEELAQAIKKVWHKKVDKNDIKTALKAQPIPSNCEYLQVPRVNSEIYSTLPEYAKSKDVKRQKQEKFIVKAAVPVTGMLLCLMDIKPNEYVSKDVLTELKRRATETITLLGYANANLIQSRRDDIALSLGRDFRQLRNDVPVESSLLFGDELAKRLNAISKTSKINIKPSSTASTGRKYTDYNRSRYASSSQSKNYNSFPKRAYNLPSGKGKQQNNRGYNNNNNNRGRKY